MSGMGIKIELRLVLYTDRGPAGAHLERHNRLRVTQFNFPLEEMDKALAARDELQEYCDKNPLTVREK